MLARSVARSSVPVLALAALLLLPGCRDLREALDLRQTVRDSLGWEEVEIGIETWPRAVTAEITAGDPTAAASPPDESSARLVARLARETHHRVRAADTVRVSFETGDEWLWGTVSLTEKRSWSFPRRRE